MYYWEANSNAAPFFSDSSRGFVEADTAMEALKVKVKTYSHSCGLHAMTIKSCEPKPKLLARFLSKRAIFADLASEMSEGGIMCEGERIRILKNGERVWLDIKDYVKEDKYENLE